MKTKQTKQKGKGEGKGKGAKPDEMRIKAEEFDALMRRALSVPPQKPAPKKPKKRR